VAKLLKEAPERTPMPQDWAELEAHVAACQGCSLFSGRSQTVFGAGPAESVDWMVIGEAPGEQDDRLGIPFQGKAGELLQAMLGCIGLGPESSVFYTNLIKCRPRGNRTPSPEEIAACLPYLQRQIALLKPRRILALGRVAALALLGDESDFEQLRGSAHRFRSETGIEIPVIVTYHPASLLSRSQHKANAWRDLNLAVNVLPGRGHAGQSGPAASDRPADSGDSIE
jgi:DNA polymerase